MTPAGMTSGEAGMVPTGVRIIGQREPHPRKLEEVVRYTLELLAKIRRDKTS